MEIVNNLIAGILAIITVFGIPVTFIITTIVFYRKTKKLETEIAVLKERIKHYEKQLAAEEMKQR